MENVLAKIESEAAQVPSRSKPLRAAACSTCVNGDRSSNSYKNFVEKQQQAEAFALAQIPLGPRSCLNTAK